MRYKTAILDDDNLVIDLMKHYVSKIDRLELVGTFQNSEQLLNSEQLKEIDLLLLDIELPSMNGLDFLDFLGESKPEIVLISSKSKYGVRAFEYDVVDYIQKPVSFSRFLKSIKRVLKILDAKPVINTNSFFVRSEGLWINVPFDDVFVIKGDNNQVIIKTPQGKITSPIRLKEILKKLPVGRFMQVHRSYIVQLNKINKIDGEVLEVNKRTVPVSKSYIKELYNRLQIER